MADTLAIAAIGPEDHGTRMSLEEFVRVEGRPGYLYELEKGIIQVVDVPGLPHGLKIQVIRNALSAYQMAYPERIYYVAGGMEAALRLPGMQSERHPDLAVYLTRPAISGPQPWDHWTPDIVVEVVSEGGEERDYQVKRDEYLTAGVRVYWIVDAGSHQVTELVRSGDIWGERRLGRDDALSTTLLPGFNVPLATVFAAD